MPEARGAVRWPASPFSWRRNPWNNRALLRYSLKMTTFLKRGRSDRPADGLFPRARCAQASVVQKTAASDPGKGHPAAAGPAACPGHAGAAAGSRRPPLGPAGPGRPQPPRAACHPQGTPGWGSGAAPAGLLGGAAQAERKTQHKCHGRR